MNLQVNQIYQFNLGYIGAVSYINYLIDFGDGTQTGWFSGIVNTTTTISQVFSTTGQFSISVAARSLAGMQVIIRFFSIYFIEFYILFYF